MIPGIPNLHVEDDELGQLGSELGGCEFDSEACKTFLQSTVSCDVQAAPGSGKTTLLVAKLVLAVRRWADPTRGICVLSHTNAARREIENRLTAGEAIRLLGYPHFVGTLTTFINRFIALPLVRGLGWQVRVIDDDVFAVRAVACVRKSGFLRKQVRKQQQFERWAADLTLGVNFEPGRAIATHVPIAAPSNMPGEGTETRKTFEAIKAELMRDGVFRFADLAVLASCALDSCTDWASYLASRFPLVLVDEAQDTSRGHLQLIERVFGAASCLQKIGDANQGIYGDEPGEDDSGWTPAADAIDLGASRRFGSDIAAFATRLTVRRPQNIVGQAPVGPRPAILTHASGQAHTVLQKFGELLATTYPHESPDAWAIASIHRPSDSASGVSLRDYHAPYRAPKPSRQRVDSLHAALHAATAAGGNGQCLGETEAVFRSAILDLLRKQSVPAFRTVSARSLWMNLDMLAPGSSERLRKLFSSFALGEHTKAYPSWDSARTEILDALGPVIGNSLTRATLDFLSEAVELTPNEGGGSSQHVDIVVGGRSIRVRLGSIASVKGNTHDATLVLQTKLIQTKDVLTALRVAAGTMKTPTAAKPVLLKATMNVFVAATRPRQLLCVALPEDDVDARLRAAAQNWGWQILSC